MQILRSFDLLKQQYNFANFCFLITVAITFYTQTYYSHKPISTLDRPIKPVNRPLVPFDIFDFDRLEFGDGRRAVDAPRSLETGDEARDRFTLVGDAFRERETGEERLELGRDDGLEEGLDRESYKVAKVAGCERLRLGVVGLERILGDLLIGALRGEDLLLVLYPRLALEVLRLKDDPESPPNRKLEVDRLSGLTLPAWLEPWLDSLDRVRLRPLELLALIFEFRRSLSCLVRRFAIS